MSTTAVSEPISRSSGNRLLAWLPTVLWLGMISFFSTDTFSAAHTGTVLWRLVHIFWPTMDGVHFHILHFFIRKGAHFTVYATLSFLSYRSWRATLPSIAPWTFKWAGLALALTLMAASSDEFHQSFVPSRTSSSHDVLLDMMGALFVQILIASWGSKEWLPARGLGRMPK